MPWWKQPSTYAGLAQLAQLYGRWFDGKVTDFETLLYGTVMGVALIISGTKLSASMNGNVIAPKAPKA